MSRRVTVDEVAAALLNLLSTEARTAADENILVAREEQADLGPWLRRWADALRVEGGKGTRVRADVLVERAHREAMQIWERHIGTSAQDARWLAKDEIEAVERDDAVLGSLTWQARQAVLDADLPTDELSPITTFFDGLLQRGEQLSEVGLPAGTRLDARPGRPEREGVPDAVLQALDCYYRMEAQDWGTSRLYKGELGQVVWVVRATSDGDGGWLDVFDAHGAWLAGRREHGTAWSWDRFPHRTRLASTWTAFDQPVYEEGMSEPDERAAAGQPPMDWEAEAVVAAGYLTHQGGFLDAVDIDVPEQWRALAVAAFDHLWGVHLFYASERDRPMPLGPSGQGRMRLGHWTKNDGQTYLTADWRDIDDGSYVLYFLADQHGLRLAIVQFDN